jgi:peptidoglycan/LPS O-acetylase OafA/YrhL
MVKPSLIHPLTGIRGLAALAVVLFHLPSMGLNGPCLYGPLAPLIDRGFLGVDLFFILSGFVLALVHQQDFAAPTLSQAFTWAGLKRFWQLRFARVYPLHAFLLVIYGAIVGVQSLVQHKLIDPALTPREWLGSLFLLQIWMPLHSFFNAPSWSISAEALAYTVFPLLAWVTSRCQSAWVNAVLMGLVLWAVAVYPWGHWVLFWQQPVPNVHSLDAIMRISLEFTLGCLLFNLHKQHATLPAPIADKAGVLVLLAMPLALLAPLPVTLMAFLMLIACLAKPGAWLGGLLGNARMVYFGEISYALYLSHMLCLYVLFPLYKRLPVTPLVQWAAALVYIAGVVWVAHVLYQKIETPARLWLRQYFGKQGQLAQTKTAASVNTAA